jgi:hypothetical protein
VYPSVMATTPKATRQSVTLPVATARRVKTLAKARRRSTSQVITELIETGLDAEEQKRRHFFSVADKLIAATDEDEARRLKEELARLTFGE